MFSSGNSSLQMSPFHLPPKIIHDILWILELQSFPGVLFTLPPLVILIYSNLIDWTSGRIYKVTDIFPGSRRCLLLPRCFLSCPVKHRAYKPYKEIKLSAYLQNQFRYCWWLSRMHYFAKDTFDSTSDT